MLGASAPLEKVMWKWTLEKKSVETEPGETRSYFVVKTKTGSDEIIFSLQTKSEAKELQEVLNRTKPAVSSWAL